LEKASGHPAQVNFGELFSYALTKAKSFPLLFKGNDFSHTDVQILRWQ
jgi:ribonuclease VapC